jgi:3-hydroxyacyl-CoA dehydrogenase/enoyl-CoA hydratase/carnithine racemase
VSGGALPEYDEVVTEARVDYVDHASGLRFAVITMDNGRGSARPATLAPLGLARLDAAVDEAEAAGVDAIALTGVRSVFLVGADLDIMRRAPSAAWVHETTVFATQVLRRFAESPLPTFALINGVALGGGLELALHCTYRTISDRGVAVGYPETRLGMVPACGGTYLTSHLAGAKVAVDLIVRHPLASGKTTAPDKAVELGLADVMLSAAHFVERSLDWAAGVLPGKIGVHRPDVDRGDSWDDAVRRARTWAASKTSGAAPAPDRALDLIALARTSTRDESDAAAADAAADLVMSEQLRAGIYAFDIVQTRVRAPAGAPPASLARPWSSVGIVGGGVMASQLAALVVQQLGVPVVVVHRNQAGLDRVLGYVNKTLDQSVRAGTLTDESGHSCRALLQVSLDHAALADVDIVIEAVAELPDVKREVLVAVAAVVPTHCVIATNTSSLSVTELAEAVAHPERVVGLHFFNPVDMLPLLEVVRTQHTDAATLATAYALARHLGKTAIGVTDRPGFVFNRLIMRLYGEVLRAAEEGTPLPVADTALESLGLPMPPTQLITFTGLPLVCHITEALHDAFPSRFPVPESLQRLIAAGKTGFYVHEGGERKVDPELYAIAARAETLVESTIAEVRDRALTALTEEIGLVLDEGVVPDVRDIDLALIIGGNFPFHLGGITPYLDREGFSERVTGKRFLSPGVASVSYE